MNRPSTSRPFDTRVTAELPLHPVETSRQAKRAASEDRVGKGSDERMAGSLLLLARTGGAPEAHVDDSISERANQGFDGSADAVVRVLDYLRLFRRRGERPFGLLSSSGLERVRSLCEHVGVPLEDERALV